MTSATADWEQVGDSFYRRVQLYTSAFDEDLEFENYIVVGSPYAGALALYRDERKLHVYRGTASAKSAIDLYSCSGKLLKRLNWDKGSIKGCGWSEDEHLLVVTENGTVYRYYDFQGEFDQFSLGSDAEQYGVVSCRFWLTGLVALLSNNKVVVVSSYNEPHPSLLANPPEGEIKSWDLISPAHSLSRSTEVLLSIGQTIHVVDATASEDRMLQNGPFAKIAVSPNGEFTALYTEDGKLWVIRSDFQEKVGEYDPKIKTLARDMQWCGNDAVVLAWEDELHIVGPNGAASQYFYDETIHLVADVDGVRVISSQACEFIQKVPSTIEDIYRLGSDSPASVLLDTVSLLDNKSPKALTNMSLISSSLAEAVDTCTEAAVCEFSTDRQKQLLKAASFGKSTIDLYPASEFVEACIKLRVLNAVRFYQIGIPISSDQYDRLGSDGLISRLITRGEFLLALRISDYLNIPTNRIYSAWAIRKVRAASSDEENTCSTIVTKLRTAKGVSFEEIARAAYDEGRSSLATQLLNYEPRAGKQVPLLLSMEEDELALDKALKSGDTDLTLFVLLQLKSKLKASHFFRLLSSRPVALSLVESTARHGDPSLLKDLYYQDDRRLDGSLLLLREALFPSATSQDRASKLRLAAKNIEDTKSLSTEHSSLLDTARLYKFQETLDADLPLSSSSAPPPRSPPSSSSSTPPPAPASTSYMGLSLHATYFRLIERAHFSRASKLYATFKMQERSAAWLKLRALVASRNWTALGDILRDQRHTKSPIGWRPYFEEILGAGNVRLAGEVVAKVNDRGVGPKDRVEMYVKCGMVGRAAEEAFKAKDKSLLEGLRGREGEGRSDVERYLAMLNKR